MTNQRSIILLSQMYLPAFDEEEKDAITKAIESLKAQEPRVLALDEIHGSMAVWLEDVDKADVILAITESEFYALHGLCRCFITSDNRRIAPLKREYGIRWRAWTYRPTDDQRKSTPWIEGD